MRRYLLFVSFHKILLNQLAGAAENVMIMICTGA